MSSAGRDPRILPDDGVPITAALGTPGFMAPEQETLRRMMERSPGAAS